MIFYVANLFVELYKTYTNQMFTHVNDSRLNLFYEEEKIESHT